jgi:hypothetical protein
MSIVMEFLTGRGRIRIGPMLGINVLAFDEASMGVGSPVLAVGRARRRCVNAWLTDTGPCPVRSFQHSETPADWSPQRSDLY